MWVTCSTTSYGINTCADVYVSTYMFISTVGKAHFLKITCSWSSSCDTSKLQESPKKQNTSCLCGTWAEFQAVVGGEKRVSRLTARAAHKILSPVTPTACGIFSSGPALYTNRLSNKVQTTLFWQSDSTVVLPWWLFTLQSSSSDKWKQSLENKVIRNDCINPSWFPRGSKRMAFCN